MRKFEVIPSSPYGIALKTTSFSIGDRIRFNSRCEAFRTRNPDGFLGFGQTPIESIEHFVVSNRRILACKNDAVDIAWQSVITAIAPGFPQLAMLYNTLPSINVNGGGLRSCDL